MVHFTHLRGDEWISAFDGIAVARNRKLSNLWPSCCEDMNRVRVEQIVSSLSEKIRLWRIGSLFAEAKKALTTIYRELDETAVRYGRGEIDP
jgi:hypothetical protein